MTKTLDPAPATAAKKRTGGLNSLLLADLKAMAGGMGIQGAGSMKKAQLVEAIKALQADHAAKSAAKASTPASTPASTSASTSGPAAKQDVADKPEKQHAQPQQSRQETQPKQEVKDQQDAQPEQGRQGAQQDRQRGQDPQPKQNAQNDSDQDQDGDGDGRPGRSRRRRGRDRVRTGGAAGGQQNQGGNQGGGNQNNQGQGNQGQGNQANQGQGNQGGGNPNRGGRHEPDTTILEDDVLVPAAGILDVLDNYAFVRTSGYLPGPDDVYLSLSIVRKYGLRRGDAVGGQVRQPREGERKEKFNPMVRIDSVNGAEPDTAKHRVEFDKQTPLNPTERLRLETTPAQLVGRLLDVVTPMGKGQRCLVVGPARSGKTMVLESIANAITANNPECHLMAVLVDERPEEVTDFQRAVKGEVVASTFDRPAADHTLVAELAIERAKRLVELGHDVVLLLDGLARLIKAYDATLPTSGRSHGAGPDPAALLAPKAILGAARNLENGGSLTIVATVLAESGSSADEAVLAELRGTASCEVRLRRDLADLRLDPAIDVVASGTRRDDLLAGRDEVSTMTRLRRELVDLGGPAGLERVLEALRRTQTRADLLTSLHRAGATDRRA